MERIIHEQTEQYIVSQNILYELQSGFSKTHPTETCILHLTENIRKEVDAGKLWGMVLLDLEKAFDSVDYGIRCINSEL